MRDNLTNQQRVFVRKVAEGKSIRQATRDAGYLSPDWGYQLMKKETIRTALQAYMHKAGITDELIARKLKEGLNAKTMPRSEGGKQYPDQFVRKQFLDVILRIRGDYAPEQFEAVHRNITLVIDGKMLEALKDSRALSAEEVRYLEHTPVKEVEDGGKMDSEGDKTPWCVAEIVGDEKGGEDTPGETQRSSESERKAGPEGEACQDAEEDKQIERPIQEGIDGEGQTIMG